MYPSVARTLARGLVFLALLGCSSEQSPSEPEGPPGSGDPPPEEPPPPPAGPLATIAYIRGGQIRAIEPDGSNDRLFWSVPRPDLPYSLSGLVWRPDGSEIAFASDHEQATSFYERDLYAVRGDGQVLRKLTNAPALDRLASYPKGTVTVSVQNITSDAGPWFVYVSGAPQPQQLLIEPGGSASLTFTDVADFGDVEQPAVAINGANRWFGDAVANVRAGQPVNAGTLLITPFGGVTHFGADGPGWRADGSRLGFFAAPTCLVNQVPSDPPAGLWVTRLLDPEVFESSCAYDWSPAVADDLLVADDADYSSTGETHIYRVSESSQTRGAPLTTFGDYVRVVDLRWLPDGSGFIVARTTALLDESVNFYEFLFATGALRQLTSFSGEFARRFSISPDGARIVYERVTALDGPSDLWIVGRDGSGDRLLVRNGEFPGWNPARP